MENPFFDTTVFELNRDQWMALVPYLWLCFGIALSTIAAALRSSDCVLKGLLWLVLLPFVGAQLYFLRMPAQVLFGTSLEVDSITRLVGACVGSFALLTSLFSESSDVEKRSEWGALLVTSVLGLAVLPGARDWVFFFVALETLAISGYILAAIDTNREKSLEAGLKYLLMGSFASALFLMGTACFYGLAGTFDFEKISEVMASLNPGQMSFAICGALLIVTSLGFKVALMPFHMWAPDVYQAAPTGVAAFLATATKLSIFASLAVVCNANGLFSLPIVKQCLFVISALSVIAGSFMAVAQSKLRRLVAYSSIVSAGYAGLGLTAGFRVSAAIVTYLALYGLALICTFAIIDSFSRLLGKEAHEDVSLAELPIVAKVAPSWLVALFALSIFSMAGIPPMPGFLGKYLILKDLFIEQHLWSAVIVLIGTLLGLAYYLRLLVPLYLESKSETLSTKNFPYSKAAASAAVLSALLMFVSMGGFSRFAQWVGVIEGLAR